MFKTVLIGAILAFANSIRVANHDAYVFDKNGNLVGETNQVKTDKTYAGPGSVALADCVGKNNGDGCKLGGTCLTCNGVIQCRYWGKC